MIAEESQPRSRRGDQEGARALPIVTWRLKAAAPAETKRAFLPAEGQ